MQRVNLLREESGRMVMPRRARGESVTTLHARRRDKEKDGREKERGSGIETDSKEEETDKEREREKEETCRREPIGSDPASSTKKALRYDKGREGERQAYEEGDSLRNENVGKGRTEPKRGDESRTVGSRHEEVEELVRP